MNIILFRHVKAKTTFFQESKKNKQTQIRGGEAVLKNKKLKNDTSWWFMVYSKQLVTFAKYGTSMLVERQTSRREDRYSSIRIKSQRH